MTKVFLPLGCGRHCVIMICSPFLFLERALESDRVSTMTCSRSTFLRIFIPATRSSRHPFFRPRGVLHLCTSAKPPGTLPLRTSSTYGRRPGQPSTSSLARRVCVQSPTTSSFLSSSTSFTVIRKYVMAPGSSCGAEGDGRDCAAGGHRSFCDPVPSRAAAPAAGAPRVQLRTWIRSRSGAGYY